MTLVSSLTRITWVFVVDGQIISDGKKRLKSGKTLSSRMKHYQNGNYYYLLCFNNLIILT